MSTHPNTILLLTLTPDDLSRKTLRDILLESDVEDLDDDITIGSKDYHHTILDDSDYDEGYQIGGKEGDLLFFDFVTYGYGDQIEFDKLEKQKQELEAWAKTVCAKHKCSYKISVTANYW